ncbi:SGNH/GDSL hydrolase family protein [Janibacter anophelis]|uniref:SGNH/GDSL hydrolase family protein n=1 Tax=Janibacter anophelis TaxID=319054 RepID=UPI000A9BF40B|nr:SGNH/GDSL hydrolase family protein [Janibacter anophelis]
MRYVAIGDSLTEGIGDDPWPDGTPRGWADRLAEMLAAHHGDVEYANLAVRGLRAQQVLESQVAPALAMEPDVVTLTAGMNDLLRPASTPMSCAARSWRSCVRSRRMGSVSPSCPSPTSAP